MIFDYSIFDSIQEFVLVIDQDGRVHYGNESVATLFETSSKRLKSKKHVSEYIQFSPEWLSKNWSPTQNLGQVEVDFKTSSGQEGCVQARIQEDINRKHLAPDEARWIIYMRDVSLEKTLHRKYRGELDQKEAVIEDLKQARAQLEDYSKNLEKMVEQRTSELQAANQLLSAVLDSLNQGIIVFDKQAKVLPCFSRAAFEIFETDVKSSSIDQILKLNETDKNSFLNWLDICYSDMLDFEDAKGLAPNRVDSPSVKKEIGLEFNAMRGANKKIQAMVLVATDKTKEVEALKQAEFEKSLAHRVLQIAKYRNQFRLFAIDAREILKYSLQGTFDFDLYSRNFHTLKGGLATFGLQEIAHEVHELESLLNDVKHEEEYIAQHESLNSGSNTKVYMQSMRRKILYVQEIFEDFLSQNKDLYGGDLSLGKKQIEVSKEKIQQWIEALQNFNVLNPVLDEMKLLIAEEEIGQSFYYLSDSMKDLAKEFGKKLKDIKFVNPQIKVNAEAYKDVFASLIHIFRNAVDHGIETPEERGLKNKNPEAEICVEFKLQNINQKEYLEILILDDGGGINPDKIRTKLQNLNYSKDILAKNDPEIIQHIFDEGFSSREEISEVSGRGIGLNAVLKEVEFCGGKLWVESLINQGTKFVIQVPILKASVSEEESSKKTKFSRAV